MVLISSGAPRPRPREAASRVWGCGPTSPSPVSGCPVPGTTAHPALHHPAHAMCTSAPGPPGFGPGPRPVPALPLQTLSTHQKPARGGGRAGRASWSWVPVPGLVPTRPHRSARHGVRARNHDIRSLAWQRQLSSSTFHVLPGPCPASATLPPAPVATPSSRRSAAGSHVRPDDGGGGATRQMLRQRSLLFGTLDAKAGAVAAATGAPASSCRTAGPACSGNGAACGAAGSGCCCW